MGAAASTPARTGAPGQCQFELGFEVIAADELSRAFLLAGEELFLDEDPKYLALVKSVLDEPPGGWD